MSLLCSPRADLWPFDGFLGKSYIERETIYEGRTEVLPVKDHTACTQLGVTCILLC